MIKPDLDGAYALSTSEDARMLYAEWAETYDKTFAEEHDFRLPYEVAQRFIALGGVGPVLDFGCGTGLVGAELAQGGINPIDGADLSMEMLEVARSKGHYRDLIAGNVLDGYTIGGAPYSGIVSSGTFTHGHVGPEAIEILLELAAPQTLFVLSVNKSHFEAAGFGPVLDGLQVHVTDFSFPEVRNYGTRATGPHKNDTGYLVTFRKL